jgi:hypothetical protein
VEYVLIADKASKDEAEVKAKSLVYYLVLFTISDF